MSAQAASGAADADRLHPETYLSVELDKSHSIVLVKRKKLELGSENSDCQVQEESKKQRRSRSRSRSRSPEATSKTDGAHRQKKLKWIKEGILVRVVSKKAFSGKLYNCVLPVQTVLSENTFEVFSS